MSDLLETPSPKAARILAAAGELLLARGVRGVTIAEVAQRAHVGKGTAYLYWKTKEDLVLELVCRDFLALSGEVTARLAADPGLVRPSRLCAHIVAAAPAHPFVNAVKAGGGELLGPLAADPRAAELLDLLGPDGVMRRVLPIWRAHGLARDDWPLPDQAFALQALLTGFLLCPAPNDLDPTAVLPAAVTALLGPERATEEQVRSAADAGTRVIAGEQAAARALVGLPAATG